MGICKNCTDCPKKQQQNGETRRDDARVEGTEIEDLEFASLSSTRRASPPSVAQRRAKHRIFGTTHRAVPVTATTAPKSAAYGPGFSLVDEHGQVHDVEGSSLSSPTDEHMDAKSSSDSE
ncbi:hypothetical protein PVAG01_11451 [Phlyctema vagabunda]|uniref:Uncharacterized protein n=1 Tax=Phlyctema vagabunda TaxID=108571 RepID=A0ABR4P2B3_9HELO